MSLLTHQSFANTDTPYWASASKPTSLVSPLSVVDTYGSPTKKVSITANANGTGGVFYSGSGGGNPFGLAFAQGSTQPGNQLILDVGNTNAAMTLTSSNVVSTLPIVVDSPLNAQNFAITPTSGGVQLTMGNAGGGSIQMTNSPTGAVSIMSNTTITPSTLILSDGANNSASMTSTKMQFGNGSGQVAQVGITGSSAYLGTNTAPLTTPGVMVNIANGAELQFTDSANVYGMKSTSGVLNLGSASVPNAISIQSTGQVDIPNLSYPSVINTTTLNASQVNSTDISANFIAAPTLSCTTLNAIGSVNTSALNSTSLGGLLRYYPSPTTSTGANVWTQFYTITGVASNLMTCPSLDVILPMMSASANNYPNVVMVGVIGVIGNNITGASTFTPITTKTWSGAAYYGQPGSPNQPQFVPIGELTLSLKSGVDYNASTTSLIVCVLSAAQNTQYSVYAGTSNVVIRGFPW